MAEKLTDRAFIVGAVAQTDLLHIVDVSDNSQDPAGSSFKVTSKDFINSYITDGSEGAMPYWDNTTGKYIPISTSGIFHDVSNNRIGVGINTSLAAKLHVKSASGTAFQVDGSSITGIFKVDNNGDVSATTLSTAINGGSVSDFSKSYLLLNNTDSVLGFNSAGGQVSYFQVQNNVAYVGAAGARIATFNSTGLLIDNNKVTYLNKLFLPNGGGGRDKILGSTTLNGTTGVAVTTTQTITGFNIFLSSVNGANNGILTYTIDSATQFTIYSSNASDTNTVNFVILGGW
jgi:hypothetical protein